MKKLSYLCALMFAFIMMACGQANIDKAYELVKDNGPAIDVASMVIEGNWEYDKLTPDELGKLIVALNYSQVGMAENPADFENFDMAKFQSVSEQALNRLASLPQDEQEKVSEVLNTVKIGTPRRTSAVDEAYSIVEQGGDAVQVARLVTEHDINVNDLNPTELAKLSLELLYVSTNAISDSEAFADINEQKLESLAGALQQRQENLSPKDQEEMNNFLLELQK